MNFAPGAPAPRVEDERLLRGRGDFADDRPGGGFLHGYVLRSPHAHARVARLDAGAARKRKGVRLALTGGDLAADAIGEIPCVIALKSSDGSARAEAPRPVLAKTIVRYAGEPVAFVVADSLAQARDAAEHIAVDYDELPAVTDTVSAAAPGAPQLWSHMARNTVFDWAAGDVVAVAAAFASVERAGGRIVKARLINNRVVVNPIEPRVALAECDAASGRLTLTTPSQGVVFIRDTLADHVFKIGRDKLRVVTGDVGGGFGMKIFVYPEQCLALWAARRLKRHVRWTAERGESFLADNHARDHVSDAELALDRDGRCRALRVTTHANLGAYLSNTGPSITTLVGVGAMAGAYKIPACALRVVGVVTNTVPIDAYRGTGRAEAAYIVERLIEIAALEMGVARDELRRRNFIAAGDMPFTNAMGRVHDTGDFAAALDKAQALADWRGFEARRRQSAARGKLRGIGLANYIVRSAFLPGETATLHFTGDDKVEIRIGNQSNGQGHATAYRQMLGAWLGIGFNSIVLAQGDSDKVAHGLTGGSRAMAIGGAAIQGAADEVKRRGTLVAADLLEANAADIEYDKGAFRVRGTDLAVSLFDAARVAREGRAPVDSLDATHGFTPAAESYTNGCHIAEVEIDADTGTVSILRYAAVDDFGAVVNPPIVDGQVHGSIAAGAGQALFERVVHDSASGQLLTGSFMDYALPRAADFPEFATAQRNIPAKHNPLGLKGAAESGTVAAPPVLVSAVVDALRARLPALTHIDMPITAEKIWRLLRA